MDRPAPVGIDGLRRLRVQLVAEIARFQQLVQLHLSEATRDPLSVASAVDLKVGAIEMGRAYDEFSSRWLGRHLLGSWPEYRLSAQRMIHMIHGAIEPVDHLPSRINDPVEQR